MHTNALRMRLISNAVSDSVSLGWGGGLCILIKLARYWSVDYNSD